MTEPKRRNRGAVERDMLALDYIADRIRDVRISASHEELREVVHAIAAYVAETGR